MKTIFKKSHLPFLKGVLHNKTGRDAWRLARFMQENDGLQHQLPSEIFLLQRGAESGDAWSMCELARTYFYHCGDMFLPHALHFWKRAILLNDSGAISDVETLPIYERILSYRSADGNAYTAMEVQCALLTEWYLTKLGRSPWETIDKETRKTRCKMLVEAVCPILHIPNTEVLIEAGLNMDGVIVDGIACWEGKIGIREELLENLERLIEVIFHELGHIVTFQIIMKKDGWETVQVLYGISDERALSWDKKEMGYEVITSEEDPDTLSYGTYTQWATFFA